MPISYLTIELKTNDQGGTAAEVVYTGWVFVVPPTPPFALNVAVYLLTLHTA